MGARRRRTGALRYADLVVARILHWSFRRASWAAVEPERPGLYRADAQEPGPRPGIVSQPRLDLVLIRGLDCVQGLLAVADRAAEDDEAVIDEPVHECRVLIPGALLPDLTRGVPASAVNQLHREIGHGRSVMPPADSGLWFIRTFTGHGRWCQTHRAWLRRDNPDIGPVTAMSGRARTIHERDKHYRAQWTICAR